MALTFIAPHEANDAEKLAAMIATLENGGTLPPVVVNGEYALTGSHRLEAWYRLGIDADAIELDGDDYANAMESMGYDAIYDDCPDLGMLCDAIYKVTENDDVKQALADQRS